MIREDAQGRKWSIRFRQYRQGWRWQAKPRLIVVDILERVRQLVPSRDKDKRSAYSADYEALITLHALATEAMISILVLHHQRKLGADDLIDTLSGTLGLGGAVQKFALTMGENASPLPRFFVRGVQSDLSHRRGARRAPSVENRPVRCGVA
jgi:hypothetical protein